MASSSCLALRPAALRMALRNHCSPNTSSRPPITSRRVANGTSRISGGPTTTTRAASAASATTTPSMAERQPPGRPTANTMVRASTISTALARKTAITRTRDPLWVTVAVITDPWSGGQPRRRCPRATPRSGRFYQFVELLQRVHMEQAIEQEVLEDPEQPEGGDVGRQHEQRLVEVAELVLEADMAAHRGSPDRHGDADGRHAPERHDLLHQVGASALAPHPLPIQVVRGDGGRDVGHHRAHNLPPQVQAPEDESEDPERDHRGDDRDHGVAEQLLGLGGVPLLPDVLGTHHEADHRGK